MMAGLGRGLTGLLVATLWYAASFGLPTAPFPPTLAGSALAAPHADPGPFPPPSGTIGLWPGDGDTRNVVGSSQGTLVGNATYGAGLVAQAFAFDGVGDAVNLGNDSAFHVSSGDFTVMAWVSLAGSGSGDRVIVSKMSEVGYPNSDGWELIKQSDGRFWFCLGRADNGCRAVPTTVMSTTTPALNSWYHVAGVRQGGSISLYVNGVNEGSSAFGSFIDTHAADLRLGSSPSGGSALHGMIDEAMLFNRALSTDEIQLVFGAGSAGVYHPDISPRIESRGWFAPGACVGFVIEIGNATNAAPQTSDIPVVVTVSGSPDLTSLHGFNVSGQGLSDSIPPALCPGGVAQIPPPPIPDTQEADIAPGLPAGVLARLIRPDAIPARQDTTGWSCGPEGSTIVCGRNGPIDPGTVANWRVGITARLAPSAQPGSSVWLQATTSARGDSIPANDAAQLSVVVPGARPDLSLTTSHPPSLSVGSNAAYSIAVSNAAGAGPTVRTITVTGTLALGLSLVSGGGNGWTCSSAGQIVTCTSAGPLAPGGSSSIPLTLGVGAAAIPSATSWISVATLGDDVEPQSANNTYQDVVAVTQPTIITPTITQTPTPTATLQSIPTVTTIPVGGAPQDLVVNAALHELYVAKSSQGVIGIIDTNTNTPLAAPDFTLSNPVNVALNRVTGRLYVVQGSAGRVAVIDAATRALLTEIEMGRAIQGIAVDEGLNRVIVGTFLGQQAIIIDGATNTPVNAVSVGGVTGVIAVNPTTHRAYVTADGGAGSRSVAVIDMAAATLVQLVSTDNVQINGSPVSFGPSGLAVDPTTNRIYVSSAGLSAVAILDGSANTFLGSTSIPLSAIGSGLAIDPAARRLYVTHREALAALSIVDLTAGAATENTAVATVPVGAGAYFVAVDPARRLVYVSAGSGSVTVIQDVSGPPPVTVTPTPTMTSTPGAVPPVVTTIPIANGPSGVAVDAGAQRAFVARAAASAVEIIDTVIHAVAGSVPVPAGPNTIAVHPGRHRAYVTSQGGQAFTAIDTLTGTVAATIQLPFRPHGVAVDTANDRVFVAYGAMSPNVAVIDATTDQILTTIAATGDGSHSIAVNPVTHRGPWQQP